MTRCEFFTQDERITGFSVSGHSGYSEAGSDIVCAAVSAAVAMAEATIKMVTESIDAYVKQDITLAKEVSDYDDVVDDAFDRVKQTLISMISENNADGEYAVDLLMIAKYSERIGDQIDEFKV